MTTPDDLAAGARAMYEAELAKANKLGFVGCPWEELEQAGRDHWIDSFSAGLAAIPDHSAELLEALEKIENQIRLCAYTSAGVPGRADDTQMLAIWAGSLQQIIAKARARKANGE